MNANFDLRLIDAARIRADLVSALPARMYISCKGAMYYIDLVQNPDQLKLRQESYNFLGLEFRCLPVTTDHNQWRLSFHCNIFSFHFRSARVELRLNDIYDYALDNVAEAESAVSILGVTPEQIKGLWMIKAATDKVVKTIISEMTTGANEKAGWNPLDSIKYESLSPLKMFHRHSDMSSWAASAQAIYALASKPTQRKINSLLIRLIGKTSALEAFKLAETISGLLDMQNPLVLYCTKKKMSGFSGIEILTLKHVITICLIGIVPNDSDIAGFKLLANYRGWERIRESHDKMLRAAEDIMSAFNRLPASERSRAIKEVSLIKEISKNRGSVNEMRTAGSRLTQILDLKIDIFQGHLPRGDQYPSKSGEQKTNSLFHFLFLVILPALEIQNQY